MFVQIGPPHRTGLVAVLEAPFHLLAACLPIRLLTVIVLLLQPILVDGLLLSSLAWKLVA